MAKGVKGSGERVWEAEPDGYPLTGHARSGGKLMGFKDDKYLNISHPIQKIVEELTEKYGLSDNQSWFLAIRARYNSDLATCRATGISPETVAGWKMKAKYDPKLPKFDLAMKELFQRICEVVQSEMEGLTAKAVLRVEELLDAEKPIMDKEGNIVAMLPDYDSRFKGLQALFHWLGKWGGPSKIDVNPTYVSISTEFAKLIEAKTKDLNMLDEPKQQAVEIIDEEGNEVEYGK